MSTVTLDNAAAQLRTLIAGLQPGEEMVIADQGQPIAKLVRGERTSWPCQAGSAKNSILWIAPDFDAPPEEFREYMQ